MPPFERDIGEHSARLDMIEKDIALMRSDVREIRDAVVSAKGGWKLLVIIGTVSGSIGAVLAKVLPFVAIK